MSDQLKKKVLTIYVSNPPIEFSRLESDPFAEERIFARRLDLISGFFSTTPEEGELFSPTGDGGREFLTCIQTGLKPPAEYDAVIVAVHGARSAK